jgi:hypothetical protein
LIVKERKMRRERIKVRGERDEREPRVRSGF